MGALKKGGWNPLTNYGFTSCKAEQPLQGMELQEKEAQKDQNIQEMYSERTYSYRCLLILDDLKLFRLKGKGKHSIGRV